MELLILNTKLESDSIIDTYKSLIWTDRYSAYGDFEVYTSATMNVLRQVKKGYYLWNRDSEHTMIIEDIEIQSNAEFGNDIAITGRSLESILTRRIVWKTTNINGDLQNGVKRLLDDAIINPSDPDRKIENFIFVASEDPAITELTLEKQVGMGDNLYETIVDICNSKEIGFKVVLTDDRKFAFSLYAGSDRSYDQLANPFVVFSPKFENIINSNYLDSDKKLKTITLVAGEGEDEARITRSVAIAAGAGTGLDRREMYTDVRYLRKESGDTKLTDAEYGAQLEQKGLEDLAENANVTTFEGEADTTTMFVYGKDFFMGDVVQVANEYGAEAKSRVTEFITSQDANGIKAYPAFTVVT